MIRKLLLLLLAWPLAYAARADFSPDTTGWWPAQKSPRQIVTAKIKRSSDTRK